MTQPPTSLQAELLSSGISLEQQEGLPYRFVDADEAFTLTGYKLPGIIIGFRHLDGSPMLCPDGRQFVRIKPSWPDGSSDKPKYLSIKGAGCRPYFPMSLQQRNPTASSPVDITEGEKKADAACLNRFDTISISGVDAWRDKRSGGETSIMLPELAALNWKNREVRLAFDSDLAGKIAVRSALRELAFELTHRGARVLITQLPCEIPDGPGNPNPSRWKNGVDDFLMRHGADAYRILRQAARGCVSKDDTDNLKWAWIGMPKILAQRALLAWTVFKDRYIVDTTMGLLRWNGVVWEIQSGGVEENLRTELAWWHDAMGWQDQSITSVVALLVDRLRRVSGVSAAWNRPHLTAFSNGTMDEAAGRFIPGHRREDHLTVAFPFPWDPTATCSRWGRFLDEALSSDYQMIQLIQAAFRWSLMPKDIEATFPIELMFDITGRRGAGKSTLVEVLAGLAGPSGYGIFRSGMIDKPEAIWSLLGKRVGIEFDAGGHVGNPGVLSSIISNEPVLTKRLYSNESAARIGIVLWRVHNDAPSIGSGGAEGLSRRLLSIPFSSSPAQRDLMLKATLLSELAGIYQWVRSMGWDEMVTTLAGAMAVSAVKESSTEALLERNPRLQWLIDEFPRGSEAHSVVSSSYQPEGDPVATHGWVRVPDLYTLWRVWADANGHKAGSSSWLGRELAKISGVESRQARFGSVAGEKARERRWRIPPMADFDAEATLGLT